MHAQGLQRKVVVSLDLDLYEKAYLLVNSNSELRRRFILCLGELHIVFTIFVGLAAPAGVFLFPAPTPLSELRKSDTPHWVFC